MNQVPLRFTSLGYGYSVCANRVLAVLVPDAAPSKRCLAQAKDRKRYVDMTSGHGVKALLLLDDGQVVGCAMSPKTVLTRLNLFDGSSCPNTVEEDNA